MSWKIIPPSIFVSSDDEERIFNVPLIPLKSPLYTIDNPTKVLPPFFCYHPEALCEVRDQGKTSYCWAFAICSLLSDMISIRYGFGRWLSVSELVSCMPFQDNVNGGAPPEQALQWMAATNFILPASDEIRRETCKQSTLATGIKVVFNSIVSLAEFIPSTQYNVLSPEDTIKMNSNIYRMKRYLIEKGPIFAAIEIYTDLLQHDGSKIYTRESTAFHGGHAIVIIGWCDKGQDNRKNFSNYPYWIVRNSWGKKWASSYDFPGYFAIRMGNNELGIESRAGSALPNLDTAPSTEAAAFTSYAEYIASINHS